jgi:Family of unknown function (DUF6084)
MPDLTFRVESVRAEPFAAAPLVVFRLLVDSADPHQTIHTVVLRCQIQIEVTRRPYEAQDKQRLRDLFGEPERWGQTLRNMLWTHASAVVPSFTGSTAVELQVPCSFDFNLAATKYFHALREGDIPLCLMFSGTFFYADEAGALRVAPIPWNKEAAFRLPVKTWREMMDHYYPNSAWLCLQRDAFERLQEYKVGAGLPTWEQALDELLASARKVSREPVSPEPASPMWREILR